MKPELKHTLLTLRQDYSLHQLTEEFINSNPLLQFSTWLQEALDKGDELANSFALSSVDESNQPSS